jgi:hypothetical protein
MNLIGNSNPTPPSNKHFAIFLTTILFLGGGLFFWKSKFSLSLVSILLGFFLLILTFLKPDSLEYLNKIWFKIGIILGKITNPVVLGFIFLVLITPVALISKIFGRDELKLKKTNSDSYWIKKVYFETNTSFFKNQF